MNTTPGDSDRLKRLVGRSAFGIDATGYHDARSGYSSEVFAHLARLTDAGSRILEIGAGTGLATEGLLKLSPRELTIIEPDPRLCQFLEGRFASSKPDVVCGAFLDAEVEGPFDLIACAAAFHWLEPVSALARIRGLLAPDGLWAMWWNCYFGHGQPDPVGESILRILERHNIPLPPSYAGQLHYSLDAEHHVGQLEQCGFRAPAHHIFKRRRTLDAGQAQALYQSFSFIRVLEEPVRQRIMDEIRILIETDFGGQADGIVVTSLYLARQRS